MPDTEETLPAAIEAAPENNGALAINAEALPEQRRFAADSIRAPLPPAVYERLGQMVLSPEAEKILDEPLPSDEADIRPDDGAVYASHEYYRRQLNRAFGRMGWTLIPGSPLAQEPGSQNYYRVWILFVGGVYVSEAMASRKYITTNARMSLDDVAEAIKSDALRRCCKDLGIATECWNKRWTEKWRKEHAVEVVASVWRDGRTMNGPCWRRKDADPLKGEVSARGADQTQDRAVSSPANPAATNPPPQSTAPAPAKKPIVPPKPLILKPDPPKQAAAAPQPAPAAPKPAPAVVNAPRLLDSQIRLLFPRGRNAGLIVGEEAAPMLEWLGELGIGIVESDGKTPMENLAATFKGIPPNRFSEIVKKLDELAKAAKPAEGDAERI